MRIAVVGGARPNFMKIGPIIFELNKHPDIERIIVHTGQHYHNEMSRVFFDELEIPEPDINLGIGSDSHGRQTAKIMIAFEDFLLKEEPNLVIVVGDVNSTLACGLAACKLNIKVAHVEAGLRSFDRGMPEEINRVLTDQISGYLFATERSAIKNLINEGISGEKIFLVGNVMIDTLIRNKKKCNNSKILDKLDIRKGEYAVLTLHRPENVDAKESLDKIFDALNIVQERIKIVFPVHPRTTKKAGEFGYYEKIKSDMKNLILTKPLGIIDFTKLMAEARFVLTDSGGIQEETTFLGIPCLTLRKSTERPVTVIEGTNTVVGSDTKRIIDEAFKILKGNRKKGKIPKFWDGKAAKRIIDILLRKHEAYNLG